MPRTVKYTAIAVRVMQQWILGRFLRQCLRSLECHSIDRTDGQTQGQREREREKQNREKGQGLVDQVPCWPVIRHWAGPKHRSGTLIDTIAVRHSMDVGDKLWRTSSSSATSWSSCTLQSLQHSLWRITLYSVTLDFTLNRKLRRKSDENWSKMGKNPYCWGGSRTTGHSYPFTRLFPCS